MEPYLIAASSTRPLTTPDYFIYALLGIACALVGILVMRLVTFTEIHVHKLTRIAKWRPLIGGMLLMPPALARLADLAGGWHWTWVATSLAAVIGFVLAAIVAKPQLEAPIL